MMEQIEISNASLERENKNKRSIEYKIPFPDIIAGKIDTFIQKFHTSYENLFDYLLTAHFNELHRQIEEDDNVLLSFLHLHINEIFSEKTNLNRDLLSNSEIKIKVISAKIREGFNIVIKTVCEELHYNPEEFIKEAVQYQWEMKGADIDAGYYYIIDDFCNLPKIKEALQTVIKKKL